MGKLRGLLMAFVALLFIGCGSLSYRPSIFSKPETPQSYLDAQRLNDLHAGIALFTIYAVLPVEISKEPIPVGSGSAWCVGDFSNYSLWVTCRHVAELEPHEIAGLTMLDRKKQPFQATVYDIVLSEQYDIALFKSNARNPYVFQLAPPGLIAGLDKESPADLLAIAGFPHGLFPAFISVGTYDGEAYPGGIMTDAAGTHGNSGSPLVHLKTMKVIGTINRFQGEKYKNKFRTDRLYAVPAYDIAQFMKVAARKK